MHDLSTSSTSLARPPRHPQRARHHRCDLAFWPSAGSVLGVLSAWRWSTATARAARRARLHRHHSRHAGAGPGAGELLYPSAVGSISIRSRPASWRSPSSAPPMSARSCAGHCRPFPRPDRSRQGDRPDFRRPSPTCSGRRPSDRFCRPGSIRPPKWSRPRRFSR